MIPSASAPDIGASFRRSVDGLKTDLHAEISIVPASRDRPAVERPLVDRADIR
jgi:hypothetical protein